MVRIVFVTSLHATRCLHGSSVFAAEAAATMNCEYRIRQLQDLKPWASDHPNSEEFPKRRVYVYYCEICNSVLALRGKLEYPQSFLFTTPDQCPICHFELAASLLCRSLNLRIPGGLLAASNTQIAPLNSRMQNSFQNLESFLNSNATRASVLDNVPQSEGPSLSFGENFLDELCGGVCTRQLAVLYGEKVCKTLAEQLCVRSQLPVSAGGFDATSIFIDGGNTFDVYQVSNYAGMLQLDHDEVLRKIKVSRAFTCYQLVNLVVEKLPELLYTENAKLVVVANPLDMFLDPEIDLRETKHTVNFLSAFLARFARENEIALVIACPTSENELEALLRGFLTSRAQVVLKAEQTDYYTTFLLEKHPDKQWASRTINNDYTKQLSRFNTEEPRKTQYPSCRIS